MKKINSKEGLLLRQEKAEYNEKQPLPNKIFYLVILVLIVFDFIALFPLFDTIINENMYLLWGVTVVLAFILELTPILIVHCFDDEYKRKNGIAMSLVLFIFFIGLVYLSFKLRINAQEYMFSTDTIELGSRALETSQDTFQPTQAQNYFTILLSYMPILTSIIAFVISYYNRPTIKKIYRYRSEIISNKERVQELEGEIYRSTKFLEEDLEGHHTALYLQARKELEDYSRNLKSMVLREITLSLNTPDATSKFLEGEEENE